MAYTRENFKSKKAAKEAIAASGGQGVPAYQPGGMFHVDGLPDGMHTFEGPHYPKPHRWYGSGTVKDGMLLNLK